MNVLKYLSSDTLGTQVVRTALDYDLNPLRLQVSQILRMIRLINIFSHFDLKAGPLQAAGVSQHGE